MGLELRFLLFPSPLLALLLLETDPSLDMRSIGLSLPNMTLFKGLGVRSKVLVLSDDLSAAGRFVSGREEVD